MQEDAELVAVTLLDAAKVHGMKVEDRGGLGREHRAEHR